MKAEPLAQYLQREFGGYGNRKRFAAHMGVSPQHVSKWVCDGWVVIDGRMYSPRRLARKQND